MFGHCNGRLVRARFFALTIITIISTALALPATARADGIAISGNFNGQHFQLIPGQVLNTPDIYIVVFNNGEEDLRVRLTPEAPIGVEIIVPETELLLPPKQNQRMHIGIEVGSQVAPGEYDLILTAEAYREGEGIKLTGAAQLQAKLSVIADAGEVSITTVSPQGEPFAATLKLYKQVGEEKLSCGYSETGSLETKLTPGDYLVEAFYQGNLVASETFGLEVDQKKTITLVPETIYIEDFTVVRYYFEDTRKLAYTEVSYAANNTYQPLRNVILTLKVTLDGELLDDIELLSLPTLDVGRMSGAAYKYVPSADWQEDSTYSFKVELHADDNVYVESHEVEIIAEPGKPHGENADQVMAEVNNGEVSTSTPSYTTWMLIGGISAAAVGIGIGTYRRRRGKKV